MELFHNQENYDNLIRKIINLYSQRGYNFSDRNYFKIFFQSIIDTELIEKVQFAFKENQDHGFELVNFVRLAINIIPHNPEETLFLIMSVIELFKAISQNSLGESTISYQDFLTYITENFFIDLNQANDYQLHQRAIPKKRLFNPDVNRVRNIDIETPVYYGKSDEQIRRLVKTKLITDSSHHPTPIKQGLYASEVKLIITLDGLSEKLNAYDLNCKLVAQISPTGGSDKVKKDSIVVSFAWSNRQMRIGATLKELVLIFWDSSDKFKYEKKIVISHLATEHQSQIWYIEFMNMWITADHSFSIYGWDIEKETTNFKIQKRLKNEIIDIVELAYIKKVAIGCLDKTLQIWNLYQSQLLMKIDFPQGGLHSIVFNCPFQVLLTAGYENSISIISLDYQHQEHNLIGKLIGHNSMVTTVQCVDKTPMVVSCDDTGVIKVWDIRKLSCIQTVAMESRNVIQRIFDIQKGLKIGFLGQRIILMEWDQPLMQVDFQNEQFPIKVEFSQQNQEIYVCSQKEVKTINLLTGKTQKIYSGLLQNSSDDISLFKSTSLFKNFIVGDHKGQMKIFSYQTGEYLNSLKSHSNEVSELQIDQANQLYISSGWDSQVYIQKEEKNCFHILREVDYCFNSNKISILELSVNHNIFAIASFTNRIYIFDYEFCRLVQCIELLDEEEIPIAIHIMLDYPVILITSDRNKLYVVQFIQNGNSAMKSKLLAHIDVSNQADQFFKKSENYSCNKILVDSRYERENNNVQDCQVYLATLSGSLCSYDLLQIFKIHDISNITKFYKVNFNPLRTFKENFQKQIEKQKINEFKVYESKEEYLKLLEFKAHKQKLTSFQMIQLNQKKLLTSSLDQFICIWDLNGNCCARLNINHPLPIKWNVEVDQLQSISKNILFALKLIETLIQNFSLTNSEQQQIQSINQTLKNLNENSFFPTEIEFESSQKKNQLIFEEFTLKDIKYEKYKQLLQKEIVGPSLKDMEFNKRFNKDDSKKQNEETKNKKTINPVKQKNQQMNMEYFSANYREELTFDNENKQNNKFCEQTIQLAQKIDNASKNQFKTENATKDDRRATKKLVKPQIIKQRSVHEKNVMQGVKFQEQTCQTISTIDKAASFFDYANQRCNFQNIKIINSLNQINENKFFEKKQFSNILKSIDSKLKAAQQKFKNSPIEYMNSIEKTSSQHNTNSARIQEIKNHEKMQRNMEKKDQEKQMLSQRINTQLDSIIIKAKEQGQINYQKKQEMRKVLDKIAQTNFCGIEDNMWLFQQKEQIIKDQNQFLKTANLMIIDSIEKVNQRKKSQESKQNYKNQQSNSNDTQDNILSFLKD